MERPEGSSIGLYRDLRFVVSVDFDRLQGCWRADVTVIERDASHTRRRGHAVRRRLLSQR